MFGEVVSSVKETHVKRVEKTRNAGDRSSSSESSVFHKDSAIIGDPGARCADRHSVMLGARMLQCMSNKLGRDRRLRDWEVLHTPALASAYHLQEVRFINPNMALNQEREMSTFRTRPSTDWR